MKTLIVEDNANFRKIIKDSLEYLFPSMVILEATEGIEAIEKIDTLRPELVFVDISLPGENGLQIVQKIKTSHPHIKSVILTGFDTLEYREAAIRCGADRFVSKSSINWEQLEALVRSLVRAE